MGRPLLLDLSVYVSLALVCCTFVLFLVGVLLSGDQFSYGDFLLHPMLMSLSFGVFGAMASISYRVFEHRFGLSHGVAKGIHASLHFAAILTGTVGVASMWETHKTAGHLMSIHSMVGIAALTVYYVQFAASAAIFTLGDADTKMAFVPLHRFVGGTLTMLCLGTIITGVLSMVNRGKPEGTFTDAQWTLNLASMFTLGLAMSAAALLLTPLQDSPKQKDDLEEEDTLVNTY